MASFQLRSRQILYFSSISQQICIEVDITSNEERASRPGVINIHTHGGIVHASLYKIAKSYIFSNVGTFAYYLLLFLLYERNVRIQLQ